MILFYFSYIDRLYSAYVREFKSALNYSSTLNISFKKIKNNYKSRKISFVQTHCARDYL